ncbi:hypothetical protein [Streptomyces sp. NPDC001250]|uniref:hypothetical protein n=1 Tax=unclassified Streptomyces TaxID=2593676 RepID=UPI00332BC16D
MGEATRDDVPDGLAMFCAELPDLRELAAEAGCLDELAEIIAAARVNRDLPGVLMRLRELLHRLGVAGGPASWTGARGIGGLPDLGGGHPVEEAYVCPLERCSRVELPGGVTVCGLSGQSLHLVRL